MVGGGGNNAAQDIRNEEAARQERVRTGAKKIEDMFGGQFTDDYFNTQRDNYTAYALPQLTDQHKDAAKQLAFALDRRGALDSSSRASLEANLEKRRALAETEIKDRANAYRTEAMAGVEGARSDLINTLNATGDVEGAVNSANARAKVLSQPPAYSPIAQAFVDFTSGLGMQAAAEKAFAYGAGPKPTFSTGLFAPRAGSVVNG
ncbi:hypothetical protein XM25_00575 [Devosia sp. H5989]|nr:hypothetical protein XM25_00575 [Devosia sp. H5989]